MKNILINIQSLEATKLMGGMIMHDVTSISSTDPVVGVCVF